MNFQELRYPHRVTDAPLLLLLYTYAIYCADGPRLSHQPNNIRVEPIGHEVDGHVESVQDVKVF